MDNQDKRVTLDELLNDVFAHLRIKVHQTQTCTATDRGGADDWWPGRLSGSQIAGKHPTVTGRRACRTNLLSNPLGHVLGVRFGTRKPVAVIQMVVHCILQNRFARFRIRRVARKHIGKATSRLRHFFHMLSCVLVNLRKLMAPMLYRAWRLDQQFLYTAQRVIPS